MEVAGEARTNEDKQAMTSSQAGLPLQQPLPATTFNPWLPEAQPAYNPERGDGESYPGKNGSTNGASAGHTATAAEPRPKIGNYPPVPVAADLAPARVHKAWLVFTFCAAFFLFAGLIGHFLRYATPPTGDQPFYLMDTISMAQDHDLNVTNNYENKDFDKFYALAPRSEDTVGMSAPYPLPAQLGSSPARPANESYGAHLFGLPLLLIPWWVVGGWFALWWPATIVFMCLVGALVGVNVFLLAHELTGKTWIALAVWAAVVFSSPVMTYSYMIFTELPTGLLLIYAFRRLALGWGANGIGRIFVVGACIAYIPWLASRCLPVAAILGLYALVQWWRYWRASRNGELAIAMPAAAAVSGAGAVKRRSRIAWINMRNTGGPASLFCFLAPIVVSLVALDWYNYFLSGAFWPFTAGGSPRGEVPPLHWPWAGFDELSRFLRDSFGLLFDRQMGLFIYAPVYLLVAVGLIAMFRSGRKSQRRIIFWLALLILPYMGLVAAFDAWNGVWCPPARYWATFVPIMAGPLAISLFALSRSWVYRIIFGLFSLLGIAVMYGLMFDPRRFFPLERQALLDWPNTGNGLPFHLDINRVLPLFTPVNEQTHVQNTAWITLASLAIVLLCYLLMWGRKTVVGIRHWPVAAHAGTWAVAIFVVGAAWTSMNFELLKPRTVLSQVGRWPVVPAMVLPRGLAYLDGKVYITDYEGQALVALDTANGAITRITPTMASNGTDLQYGHPGDIKVGPDGLLYLLNNGPNEDAMYVMQPDGKVVRRMALQGKSSIAVGFQFAPDGTMVVADMVGAQLRRYPAAGGDAVASYGGERGGFNNVFSVAVDSDGTMYAAESSERRIQQIDPNGKYIRSFDLQQCSPNYVLISGDWLDTSCGNTMLSVNKKTGTIQHVRTGDNDPLLGSPIGLSYAPDGTLYTVQFDNGNTIIVAYKVQH